MQKQQTITTTTKRLTLLQSGNVVSRAPPCLQSRPMLVLCATRRIVLDASFAVLHRRPI